MSLKEKQEKLKQIQSQISEVYKTITPLQQESTVLREEIRKLEFKAILPLTPEKVLTTNYQVFEGNENYKALQEYLRQFKFVQCEGYNAETELKALKIKLSQKVTIESQLAELNLFLPFVSKMEYSKIDEYGRIPRPQGLEGQVRAVSIFEHTCSEHGSYSMLVGDNDVASLLIKSYSSPRILQTLPLSEMIAYIRKNHPYELSEEMEEINLDIED